MRPPPVEGVGRIARENYPRRCRLGGSPFGHPAVSFVGCVGPCPLPPAPLPSAAFGRCPAGGVCIPSFVGFAPLGVGRSLPYRSPSALALCFGRSRSRSLPLPSLRSAPSGCDCSAPLSRLVRLAAHLIGCLGVAPLRSTYIKDCCLMLSERLSRRLRTEKFACSKKFVYLQCHTLSTLNTQMSHNEQ